MIRVLIVDDQPLVRTGLRALLEPEPGMSVVGEASRGDAAVVMAARVEPHVILMDIRMPGMDGIEATRRIVGNPELRGARVILLTTFENDEYIFNGLRAGAVGFLVKDIEPTSLLQAVRVVAAGEALLSPGVTRRLIEKFVDREEEPPAVLPDLDHLTDREREVLLLVAKGLSNDDIARRLHCSPATAKTHVSRAMVKLGANNRVQLVVYAYETGLVRSRWQGR
ncbi:response regulator transcription factor [Streptosporangium sp. KLBMP 9127]|nr:response regulator transcription factor [Streptosporangium sp. KLBMP 9127]